MGSTYTKEIRKMKKLITIAGAAALTMTLTGCAGSFDTFQKAYDTCSSPSGITVSDGGKTLIIDGMNEYYIGATISDTVCVLNAVELPSYIRSNMETTNSLMGRQSDTFGDKIDVSWSYHPDNGLDIVIHKN
jgi:hypothetical protein